MQNLALLANAIGDLHPLVLHLPIGLLIGVACLEIWSVLRPRAQSRAAARLLLALAAAGAVAAAASGLLLGESGSYDEHVLWKHRSLGLGTAALALLALFLQGRGGRSEGRSPILYRLSLFLCVVAMAGAAHYGGTIAHGGNPLLDLGGVVATMLGRDGGARRAASPSAPAPVDTVTATAILATRCEECHGAEKQKHGLRLDSRAAALVGGKSGRPAIVPGNAMASLLVEAITLPSDNERAMPPKGKPRLGPGEIIALIDWINSGAPWPSSAALEGASVAPPAEEDLAALRAAGFALAPLAQGHSLLRVDRVPNGAMLAALGPVAANIAWLDLADLVLVAEQMKILSAMPNLSRLELQRSNVGDADLAFLAELTQLEYLNLHQTAVGDGGLEHLRGATALRHLYVWQTQVSDAGVARLSENLPDLTIDRGAGDFHFSSAAESKTPDAGDSGPR